MKLINMARFSLVALLVFACNGVFSEEQDTVDEDVEQSCENEARAAGMQVKEEVSAYIDQCVEEMSQLESEAADSQSTTQE